MPAFDAAIRNAHQDAAAIHVEIVPYPVGLRQDHVPWNAIWSRESTGFGFHRFRQRAQDGAVQNAVNLRTSIQPGPQNGAGLHFHRVDQVIGFVLDAHAVQRGTQPLLLKSGMLHQHPIHLGTAVLPGQVGINCG